MVSKKNKILFLLIITIVLVVMTLFLSRKNLGFKNNENEGDQYDLISLKESKADSIIRKGNRYFVIGEYDSALQQYLEGRKLILELPENGNYGVVNSNIGVIYLSKGYYKTAVSYFVAAEKIFNKFNIKDENYWIIRINHAVAHMDRGNLVQASEILNSIQESASSQVKFLKFLNLAKINALKKRWEEYDRYVLFCRDLIEDNKFYTDVFLELQLQFDIEANRISDLKHLLKIAVPKYSQYYIRIQILLQHANFIVNQQVLGDNAEYERIEEGILNSDNLNDQKSFFDWKLKIYQDSSSSLIYSMFEQRDSITEVINKETNTLILQDFYEFSKVKDFLDQIKDLSERNEYVQVQSSIKNYIIGFFFLLFISLFLILILVRRIQIKKRELTENKINHTAEMLKVTQREEHLLRKKLDNQSQRISDVFAYIKKIELLRKHFDTFLMDFEKRMGDRDKDLVVSLKSNVLSFFNNYNDLMKIGVQKDEKVISNEKISSRMSVDLNEKEIELIQFILQDFTSKEIAVLINKSEKTVEYYRRKLREKLRINNEVELKIYLKDTLEKP